MKKKIALYEYLEPCTSLFNQGMSLQYFIKNLYLVLHALYKYILQTKNDLQLSIPSCNGIEVIKYFKHMSYNKFKRSRLSLN